MDNLKAFASVAPMTVGDESCACENQPPTRFCLLKFGKNAYTKGGKESEFEFTPELAQKMVEEFVQRNKDLVVDYDHATLNPEASAEGNAPAAGWVDGMESDDDGVYVNVKKWSPKAAKRMMDGEYRYMSPVLQFNGEAPVAVHSIGLTNHPAIHGSQALVAANDESAPAVDPLAKFKDAAKAYKDVLDSAREGLFGVLQEFADTVKDNAAGQAELTAFSDALFAFADVPDKVNTVRVAIEDYRKLNSVPMVTEVVEANKDKAVGFVSWLEGQMKDETDATIQQLYRAEIDMYREALDKLAQAAAVATPPPAAPAPEAPAMLPANDDAPAKKLALSDDRLEVLVDTENAVKSFLKLHDASDLSAVTVNINSMREAIAMHDAEKVVEQALNEGKITAAQRDLAVSMARKDLKTFNEWMSKTPQVVTSFTGIPASEARAAEIKPLLSLADQEVARAFGLPLEEMADIKSRHGVKK